MKTKIFYTTNAGLYFCSGTCEVLIDGIHNAGAVGFDPMNKEMEERMRTEQGLFVGNGALLFTHLHKDHYDETAVNKYVQRHPETALFGPGLSCKGMKDFERAGDIIRFRYGDFTVTAYKTRHSGPKTLDVPHCSFLLHNEASKERFFVAGDAFLEEILAERIRAEAGGSTNAIYAFVMTYQLVEKESVEFIEALSPSRIFLIHKPGPEDEAFKEVSGIMGAALRQTSKGLAVEEPDPMHWII